LLIALPSPERHERRAASHRSCIRPPGKAEAAGFVLDVESTMLANKNDGIKPLLLSPLV
jgi:predicted methyltransferase